MGYIGINRKLFDHFLWKESRIYSKAEAWIDLIQLVSYTRNNGAFINGYYIEWDRGQYPVSYSFLSKRWTWSVSKVRAFMTLLKSSKQITVQTTNAATIITLCNYETYNPETQADKQAEEQGERQANSKRTAGIKEGEEGKEKKKEEPFDDFERYEKEDKAFIEKLMSGAYD